MKGAARGSTAEQERVVPALVELVREISIR